MNRWAAGETGEDRIEVFETLEKARGAFGENFQGFVFQLTRLQAEELLQGKVVAFDIGGREYAGFLKVEAVAKADGAASRPGEDELA